MSEKTWCGEQTKTMSPKEFVARYEALSGYSGDADPGRHHTPADASAEGASSVGWPYVAAADVTVDAYKGEVVLFDGTDGTFYLSAEGKPGFRRGEYDFTYSCVIPAGKTVNLQLIATQKETVLVLDGKYYYEPQNNRNSTLTRSSTFVLPLERVGTEVSNLQVTRETVNLNEREADCNYALQRPVSVSGLEVNDGRFAAELAVDGDANTRVSFDRTKDEQWLQIDLGQVREINRVDISFFEHISDYSICVSTDGETFTEVARVQKGEDQAKQVDTVSFAMVSARYVRYEQHKRFYIADWNAYYSGGICEIAVYGLDEAKYTTLLEEADALLASQAMMDGPDLSALRAVRSALRSYLREERRFLPHLDALADTLQVEIDRIRNPEPDVSSSEGNSTDVEESGEHSETDGNTVGKWALAIGAVCAVCAVGAVGILWRRKKWRKE